MSLLSYHIFMFPFKWEIAGNDHLRFSEKTSLNNFSLSSHSHWENIANPKTEVYKRELYNEKNFFYPFTHQIFYDEQNSESIIRHYERKEPYQGDVRYKIGILCGGEKHFSLKVRSIGLNLYGAGVGILIFYLENDEYPELNDIALINQLGRRIYPPFIHVQKDIAGTKESELPDHIAIEGLKGNPNHYHEDFTSYRADTLWRPARFITHLIHDFSKDIVLKPVIDDRMFVMCWYGNDNLSEQIKDQYEKFKISDDWYRFLFVDGGSAMCQNDAMREELIKKHTYARWQKWGSLYGCTRYSMVLISENSDYAKDVLLTIFRTMYTRMAELSLVQRASILQFSEQVTQISRLESKETGKLVLAISDLYRSYIRFMNKVYFNEITAQEQGIEIYDILQAVMKIADRVKELDAQIEELHNYVNILEDKDRNTNIELLTIISSVIIIPTLIFTFAVMKEETSYRMPLIFLLMTVLTIFSIKNKSPEKRKLRMVYALFFVVFLLLLILTFIRKQ